MLSLALLRRGAIAAAAFVGLAFAAVVAQCAQATAAPPAPIDLGTLGGTNSEAFGISADGSVIVGDSDTPGDAATHAFSYSGAIMTDIGTLGGTYASARGVSSDGSVIVGFSFLAGDTIFHAFSYSGAVMTDIGTLGGTHSQAFGVSADGTVIVGTSHTAGDVSMHAFAYSGAIMTDLGTLGGTYSEALGVSADGSVIVGDSWLVGDAAYHAFSYSGGAMTDLGTLGGALSIANAVSADGSVIVGWSNTAGVQHAFAYSGAMMTDLGTLGGSNSYANAVSANGSVIVGASDVAGDGTFHAFSYSGATMTDIGTLGGSNSEAFGVSADGSVVVGVSDITGDTAQHAFAYMNSIIDINVTAQALAGTASNTRNYADMRTGSLWSMVDYDCAAFGTNGICMSLGGRYASQSGSFDEAAGTVIIAARLGTNARGGVFLDYADSTDNPSGFKVKDSMPTFGALFAYEATPGTGGFAFKLTGAYQSGKLDISRQAYAFTEAGYGRADSHSYLLNAEWAYGFKAGPSILVTPFVGLRYSDVTRGAYSEATTPSVTFPISYAAFSQKVTTVTAGARIATVLTQKLSARARLGIEQDVSNKSSDFAGTSTIPFLTSFSYGMSEDHRTRGFASAGLTYQVTTGQSIFLDTIIRQRMNGNGTSEAAMLGYRVAF